METAASAILERLNSFAPTGADTRLSQAVNCQRPRPLVEEAFQPSEEGSVDQASNQSSETTPGSTRSFVRSLWGVRYQVKEVDRSADFYTEQLGFKLDRKNAPAFAQVSIGDLKLILSGPGASGSRPMSSGHRQEPGGWNRVVLEVGDAAGN
jgi:hypothetical protein